MSALNGFSENAELYTTSKAHAQTEDLERCLEHLGTVEGIACLDVATGTGHTAFFFAERFAHVFATDPNQDMLDQAQEESDSKSLSVRFLKGHCGDLNFDDETFEIVSCRLAAHHFPALEPFLSEVHRVLKPGGKVVLIDNIVPADTVAADWINDYERRRDPTHQACYSQQTWQSQLAQFTIIFEETFPKTLDYAAWMTRMSVEESVQDSLWSELESAPQPVLDFLKPKDRKLTLNRLLIVAEKA